MNLLFKVLSKHSVNGIDAQVELQLLAGPIHTLVVPFEALDVTQIQIAQA